MLMTVSHQLTGKVKISKNVHVGKLLKYEANIRNNADLSTSCAVVLLLLQLYSITCRSSAIACLYPRRSVRVHVMSIMSSPV